MEGREQRLLHASPRHDFVIYVIALSNIKRYMSIEFIGGTCGFIIASHAMHSELLGTIGSILAPVLIRLVLKWQERISEFVERSLPRFSLLF
ncbi:hypothetical protein JCM10914A_34750 [Paenibacillus sp. JCM 10914]|uniref:hypothetical protein n=1 Tax=Paenibacillus sp. JCM 10914 TaxID=1236974 RepID=UPI0003CCAFE2|nr:hypothetical protein [Paenibacillus sp. JCM 10914]GAE04113.1 hypothetical protein JCM10914_142 [Paenibacillus sp. JCM 10914]